MDLRSFHRRGWYTAKYTLTWPDRPINYKLMTSFSRLRVINNTFIVQDYEKADTRRWCVPHQSDVRSVCPLTTHLTDQYAIWSVRCMISVSTFQSDVWQVGLLFCSVLLISQMYDQCFYWSVTCMISVSPDQSDVWSVFLLISQMYDQLVYWSVRCMISGSYDESGVWSVCFLISQM